MDSVVRKLDFFYMKSRAGQKLGAFLFGTKIALCLNNHFLIGKCNIKGICKKS